MAVEAARQGDLKGAEAHLAVLPGQGFDQVLLPLLPAWIKAGQGDVDGRLQPPGVLQGDGGTGVLHDLPAAPTNHVAGPRAPAAQRFEGRLAAWTRPPRPQDGRTAG